MHVGLSGLLVVGLAMFIGALVQGSVGFGAVIVAFPLVVLVEPALLPQSIMLATFPLTVVVFLRNRANAVWPEVATLALTRLPGVALGVVIVEVLRPTALAVLGAVFILVAVAITAFTPPVPRRPGTLVGAGLASGFFGTSVGIGGPPIGLLYQHDSGSTIRATVGTVGLIGVVTTAIGLSLGGAMSVTDLRTGFALMPFGLAGALSARYLTRWADQRVRLIVQAISVLGAVLAIVRLSL